MAININPAHKLISLGNVAESTSDEVNRAMESGAQGQTAQGAGRAGG